MQNTSRIRELQWHYEPYTIQKEMDLIFGSSDLANKSQSKHMKADSIF